MDLLNQVLKVAEEDSAGFAASDDLEKKGHGQMRLAGTAGSHQKEPLTVRGHRPAVDKISHRPSCTPEDRTPSIMKS